MLGGSRHLGKILGYSLSPIKISPSRRLDLSCRVGRGDIWLRQWELLENRAYNKPNGCSATRGVGSGYWCNKQKVPLSLSVKAINNRRISLRYTLNFNLVTAVAQWLRYCAKNQKIASSIRDGVIGNFYWHKSFWSHYGPGVDLASNRNEYREYFLGVNAADA
jgi:hypothetical protein